MKWSEILIHYSFYGWPQYSHSSGFFSSWNETKFWIIIHFMDSHNIHIRVACFLHEIKRNFDSWIATKFTNRLIFFVNWNKIFIHYFFYGLKWYVHSIYLLENRYSHKIHIWMYSFFHEIPSNNNIPLASRSKICKRLFVYDSLSNIEIFASFFDIFLQS